MKKIILIVAVLALSGCGWFERSGAYLSGYSETCIEGVTYYQFPSGVTVAYNQDGSIKACE